jgi:hypothetical protein
MSNLEWMYFFKPIICMTFTIFARLVHHNRGSGCYRVHQKATKIFINYLNVYCDFHSPSPGFTSQIHRPRNTTLPRIPITTTSKPNANHHASQNRPLALRPRWHLRTCIQRQVSPSLSQLSFSHQDLLRSSGVKRTTTNRFLSTVARAAPATHHWPTANSESRPKSTRMACTPMASTSRTGAAFWRIGRAERRE